MSVTADDPPRTSPPHFDPLQLYEDPYPLYSRLREEAPLYHSSERDCWVLSRYEDVSATARDWRTYSSSDGDDLDDTSLLFAPAGETAHADPPLHTRLRGSVHQEFRVKAVREKLTPVVRTAVRRLVGEISQQDEVDFVAQLALPLPGSMVCTWLGFAEEDHERLLGWFRAMAVRTPGQIELPASAYLARDAMRAHAREAMFERRSRPHDDLLTVLAAAVAAGEVSEDEALGMTTQLFFAGITTTAALIGNSLLNLSRFEAQLRRMQQAPELIPAGVEELLRFEPPVQWLTRVTTRDVELYGTALPAGSRVLMLWAAANRDERRWPHADELDIERSPHRHLAFGEGIHHCLGAPLARLEATMLFEELLPRLHEYEIIGPVQRPYAQSERTVESLPARVSWR
jgi:cytochrome P450